VTIAAAAAAVVTVMFNILVTNVTTKFFINIILRALDNKM
jgi:hypothetical protein